MKHAGEHGKKKTWGGGKQKANGKVMLESGK